MLSGNTNWIDDYKISELAIKPRLLEENMETIISRFI
jgi:hypothetical protein